MKQAYLASAFIVAVLAASPALAAADEIPPQWPVIGVLGWIVAGVLAGWLASIVFDRSREQEQVLIDLVLGVVGAFIGADIYQPLATPGGARFSAWSELAALVGAVVLLLLFHLIAGDGDGKRLRHP